MSQNINKSNLNCFQSAVVEIFEEAPIVARFATTSFIFWHQMPRNIPFSKAYINHLKSATGGRNEPIWTPIRINSDQEFYQTIVNVAPCAVTVDIKQIFYRTDLRRGTTPSTQMHSFAVMPKNGGVIGLIDQSASHSHVIYFGPDTVGMLFKFPLEIFIIQQAELLPHHLRPLDLALALNFDAIDTQHRTNIDRILSNNKEALFLMYSRRHFCNAWANQTNIDLHALGQLIDSQIASYHQMHFAKLRAQIRGDVSPRDHENRHFILLNEDKIVTRLREAVHILLDSS